MVFNLPKIEEEVYRIEQYTFILRLMVIFNMDRVLNKYHIFNIKITKSFIQKTRFI